MASLETLRRTILRTLEENRALLVGVDDSRNRRELAGILADSIACFIATEAAVEAFADVPAPTEDDFFKWPPPTNLMRCEALRPDGVWVPVTRDQPGFPLVDIERVPIDRWHVPLSTWRYLEGVEPADGGFGARHKGRPRLTIADADTCAACHEAHTSCQRLFFPSALGRPGGGKWLIENVLCLRGAHRRAALRWILKTRGP